MANEKRLISVDDCPCDGCQAKPCGHPARCVKFALWLNKTVDAVPVVRCKDCKHFKAQNQGAHRNCATPYCVRVVTVKVSPDDFCSFGERNADD